MNEFFKEFQKFYIKNKYLTCEITFANNIYKLIVKNGDKVVIKCSGMSAYNVGSLAYSQLAVHREELT